jgi:hypothetical protein
MWLAAKMFINVQRNGEGKKLGKKAAASNVNAARKIQLSSYIVCKCNTTSAMLINNHQSIKEQENGRNVNEKGMELAAIKNRIKLLY